jgi:WD40 repeat protein
MKKFFLFPCIFLAYIICVASLGATSLISITTQPNYRSAHYVFRKNDLAQGFVRLNNGFTVLPDACVRMDVLFSVSGAIDLRETGTLLLLRDLVLADGVTFSSGGNLGGKGCRLILDGDVTIPSNKVMHITKDLVIDAKGHTFNIGANAQIFVDTNVTLTLCNMTITNRQHASTFPPIRCAALTSKLAFDDVVFTPVGDFLFPSGQLFIHNDVAITGTSAFIYTSPVPSFITSGACWYFGTNTTFSVAPATFTDAPYTLKNTYTENNFIKMADATSVLYFNGCSLQTTITGCRFTKGLIAFDNKNTCKSDTTLTLTSITLRATQNDGTFYVKSVNWSPNGHYLAAGGYSSGNEVQVYSFNGLSLTLAASRDYGDSVNGVSWSPDGRYLAVGGSNPTSGNEVQIYSFDGSSLTLVASYDYGIGGAFVASVNWRPDGCYLAAGGSTPTSGNEVQIYSFNGSSLTLAASYNYGTSSSYVTSVNWSPDGRFLAIGGSSPASGNEAQVCSFNGSSLTLAASRDYGDLISGVSWSPDGRYLAVGGSSPASGNEVQVYSFNGSSLTLAASYDYGLVVYSVNWSPNGRYLAVGGYSPASGNEVQVYLFNSSSLTLVAGYDYGSSGPDIYSINWKPDGYFLAIGGDNTSLGHEGIEILRADYVNNTVPQALSNSVVFGNSSRGSSYDARVNVLAGAQVGLSGAMSYDSVSGLLGDEEW